MNKPKAPAGCICGMIHSSRACLTCTCPDCGSHARYGNVIEHLPGCSPEALKLES